MRALGVTLTSDRIPLKHGRGCERLSASMVPNKMDALHLVWALSNVIYIASSYQMDVLLPAL